MVFLVKSWHQKSLSNNIYYLGKIKKINQLDQKRLDVDKQNIPIIKGLETLHI